MAREIKLNSSDWCDLVFQGKNKSYGAYTLRQSSSKRHIVAFGIIILFVGAVSALPSFLEAVKPADEKLKMNRAVTLSDLETPEPEEQEVIRQELAPPPPPVRASIQFTPPVITETPDENREMRTQAELQENTRLEISIADNFTGSTDANAISLEELNHNNRIVQAVEEEQKKPFEHVEQMPEYPGGTSELMRFLANNIKYPAIAAENSIEGRVVIRFVVGKDGKVSDINVLRSLDPSCDKEAIRVIKAMPNWIPGMQNGRKVAVYYTLPVLFKLQR